MLLLGVASGIVLASLGRAAAEDLNWAGLPGAKEERIWEDTENWLSGSAPAGRLPTAGDTLTISSGNGSLGTEMSVDTLNHDGGTTAIGHYGVLNVSTFNLSGGRFQQSNGGPPPQFMNGPPGITNIVNLLNITGGTLAGQGEVNVGAGGRITQSGGIVNAAKITTPSYEQTGGAMGAGVSTSTYALSGILVDGEFSSEMRGEVRLDTLFTLSGDGALVSGSIIGDGSAAMVQDGGSMTGRASGLATYTQSGGSMTGNVTTDEYSVTGGSMADGDVAFSKLFALSGDDTVIDWMYLTGARDAVMTQSGGKMGAGVFNESLDGIAPGIGKYSQSGGEMSGWVAADTYELSGGTLTGSVHFSDMFLLSDGGYVDGSGYIRGDGDAEVRQSGGVMDSSDLTDISSYSQSGGTMNSTITVDRYTQSGGAITGSVNADTYEFAGGTGDGFEKVSIGSTLLQSGGTFDRDNLVVPIFAHSGGLFSGSISAQTYNLTGAGATSTGGAISASDAFNLAPASGTATVDALLSGSGGIVKSGNSTVILNNSGNSFTGAVVISAGVLEVRNDALPDAASVAISSGAALRFDAAQGTNTVFMGTMTGATGALEKAGLGILTLGGNINLGQLLVNAGELHIGDGTTTETASFDSAVIATDATLYIASGATLTIRIPKNIVNYGTLINDGTVNDDLDNAGAFVNYQTYNAALATNTGTINNTTTDVNFPAVWTGDVKTNAGKIYNNAGSSWTGNIIGNTGLISNMPGGVWNGIVEGNTGAISNNGDWVGDVEMNGTYGVDTGLNYGKVIYNSTTGTWDGNIKANSSWIVNAGGTWTGDIEGNNADIWNDNAADEVGTGYWIGDILANNGGIFNGGGGNWDGDIHANAYYIKSDKGAVWTGDVLGNSYVVENRGTWTGDVVANARMLYNTGVWTGKVFDGNTGFIINGDDVVDDQNDGTWYGDVEGNGSTGHIDNRGGVWTGRVLANSGTISNTAGTLNKVATGDATWIGDVVTNAGTILNAAGSTWRGDVLANTGTITTAGIWSGNFASAGTVNAQNRINGSFTNSGLLHLTGSLAGITTLTNSGIIDMQGAGAAQTLNAASATLNSTSTLKIDVDFTGRSDKIVVAGTAALGGNVYISGAQASGMADYTAPYEFLTTASRTGTFLGVTTDLAFLSPTLTYDTDSAFVTLTRNTQSFTATGDTPNQKEVAASINALGAGNAVYDAVLFLNQNEAQNAFNQLSGEAHASLETASIESADLVGAVATGRIAQAFAKVDGEGSASGYASDAVVAENPVGDSGFWTQFYGAVGIVETGSSSAGVNSTTGGAAIGLDGVLGDWRLGMMLHAGATGASVASLNSTSNSTDYGIGIYGGRQWGDTTLSLGVVHTRHDIRSRREVAFPGFTDTLSGAYASGTTQVFGEVSHAFDLGSMAVTPYAGISYVSHATDSFTETGGAASLTSSANVVDATFTTLGVSADRKFVIGDDMLLTATASLGWRHAFADAPGSTHTLTGGASFATVGTPVVADMLMFGAGLNLDMSAYNALDLVYDGQAGGNTQTHSLTGTWSTRF